MTDLKASTQSMRMETAPADGLSSGEAPGDSSPSRATDREEFFRQSYARHFRYVWSSLARFGVWERDLEDASHEVFLVLYRRFDDFDQSRALKPWLLGIAFRVASNYRQRAQHRHEVADDKTEAVDHGRSAVDVVAAREARALVAQALSSLDDEKRMVFVLHELEGRPVPECATLLGVPLNTCYSRLRLARVQFTMTVRALRGANDEAVTDD